jgi:hypothetical protein
MDNNVLNQKLIPTLGKVLPSIAEVKLFEDLTLDDRQLSLEGNNAEGGVYKCCPETLSSLLCGRWTALKILTR